MAEVTSAKQATDLAIQFLQQYYWFNKPLSASKKGNIWGVKVDVGGFIVQVADVQIDASTSEVIGYELPNG
jgi:hypothetical protein